MRVLLATLAVVILVVSSCPLAWSQNDDPFGDGPATRPPTRAKSKKVAPVNPDHRALIERAKKAMVSRKQAVHVATPRQYEAERRIMSALGDETSQTFIETPLAEALQIISAFHDIPIIADNRALEEIGLSVDTTVSLSLKNVTLRSYLRLMLRQYDLTYLVKDEVLQITTVEAAEQNLVLEMYVLPNNLVAKADKVILALQSVVVPDTWAPLGGPSTALSIDHVLVVSTTSDVHDKTKDFLANLIEKYGQ